MNLTSIAFSEAKHAEARKWLAEHLPDAPRPRLIDAVLKQKPWPTEPLTFG